MTSSERGAEESSAPEAGDRWGVPRGPVIACALAVLGLALIKTSPLTFVDPDVWHQMSLAREIWAVGHIPAADSFSYTPTLRPLVHHEWGAGMLWLALATSVGAEGFLLFKYLLVAAVIGLSARAARRGGADGVALVTFALPAMLLAHYGFTTIRPQLLSLVLLAALLNVLQLDGRRRWWVLAWLPAHVLWLNVHAGFVVGLGFIGLSALERAARREPFAHLAALTVAASALVLVNPWGVDFIPYLVRGLSMERPHVTEWMPLWADLRLRWADLATWGVMLALSAYAVRARGLRACRGISLVAVCFPFAAFHQRHVTLLAVTWFALVVPWLAQTPLGERAHEFFARRARIVMVLGGLGFLLWTPLGLLREPWTLKVPADAQARAEGWPTYPVGAADYLEAVRFRGNVMTPFVEGAYVMWRLSPQGVRVSYDGRYEAAYLPSVAAAHRAFYGAGPGWDAALTAYPTDLVLVPRPSPPLRPMLLRNDWAIVYGDDMYVLFARPGLELPFVDHRGRGLAGRFP